MPNIVRIEPQEGWVNLNLSELWDYRDLLYLLVWREIRGRYRQMALGPLWIVLQPLISIFVFSIIFGKFAQIPSDDLPYPIFSYTALLPWTLFATAVTKSSSSLVNNINLISKVYFPRLIVPISAVLIGIVDFGASFGILLLMMLIYKTSPSLNVLFLPFYCLLAVVSALTVGLWLASLSVKFRDVAVAVSYLVQVWFYATPIVYPVSIVPPQWQFWYRLNPMTQVVEGFRWALLERGHSPDLSLLVSAIGTSILLFLGIWYFQQTEGTIVDSM